MIAFDCGLIAYAERYLLSRDVSPEYAAQLRHRVGAFCSWAGADVPVCSLTCDLANEWLAELASGGMNPQTISGYRQALLAVWNDAYLAGENEHPPLRLRRIKKPQLLIEAYSHAEIKLLLNHAATLTTKHRDGNPAADFWAAAIHTAYSCGPRRGDLLRVEWRQVSDRLLTFTQHKTGYAHSVLLSVEALACCQRLATSGLLLPWPYKLNWFSESFGRLRDSAGVTRGSFKWVRRSAGSYAEKQRAGDGSKLLGQRCDRVFRKHYQDVSIVGQAPVEPPPL